MKAQPTLCCPTCGKPSTLYALRGVKPAKEDEAYRKRIRNLIARFELEGYDTYDEDLSVACALAQIMAVEGEKLHLHQLLDRHAERIIASSYLEVSA